MLLTAVLAWTTSMTALWSEMRRLLRRLRATRRPQSEYERLFSDSADCFELERREQAWNRWHDREGSLLGR